MEHVQPPATQRELWVTPAVRSFLENCGEWKSAAQLLGDIVRALDGRDPKDGCIRFTGEAFMLYIIDSDSPGGCDRVLVWHWPSDGGIRVKESILEKTSPYSIEFV